MVVTANTVSQADTKPTVGTNHSVRSKNRQADWLEALLGGNVTCCIVRLVAPEQTLLQKNSFFLQILKLGVHIECSA